MAFRDLTSNDAQLASPTQAARLFNPDGKHPIRQKHLFIVRFLRETQSANANWQDPLTFVVKSIDRPAVQAVTEELNQYNKKRVIHTGVKYQPINCTLYDTADGAAMNMWLEYARYYYGDYNQDLSSYNDDILNDQMANMTTGYGFKIRPTDTSSIDGANTQNFFSRIEVYQFWGNEYTKYSLVNPRITAFNPDDLGYESAEANTVQMSIVYEAINHENAGRPQEVANASLMASVFQDGEFRGELLEVTGPEKMTSFVDTSTYFDGNGEIVVPVSRTSGSVDLATPAPDDQIERTTTSSEGGVLARFGNWDWGSTQRNQFDNLTTSAPAIGGSVNLANFLSGSFGNGSNVERVAGGNSIEAAVGRTAMEYVDGLVTGVSDAAKATGLTPSDHASRTDGLQLSNVAIAGTNRTRDGTSMVGQRLSTLKENNLGTDNFDV